MSAPTIRTAAPGDEAGAYDVCLKTGDAGGDATSLYREDPEALGRLFVGPYLALERSHSLIAEDALGVCGYALAALDSRRFYDRYEREWRPELCARFPDPQGDPATWTPLQQVYAWYHHPDYFCPEPYAEYPSHLHIDLLPRVQGQGLGRRMMAELLERLQKAGSPGVHLGMWARNTRAHRFYQRLGFAELVRVGAGHDQSLYMGKHLPPTGGA